MEKYRSVICKRLLLLFVLFSIKVSSQTSELVNSTFIKLKNDQKSFEQFVFYGFCNCADKFVYTSAFLDNYIISFNHLEPFPRFFEKNDIKVLLDHYQNLKKKDFAAVQEKYYNGYVIITKCRKIYDVENKDLRKIYNDFISDKTKQTEWSIEYMKDYLNSYFIKVETE